MTNITHEKLSEIIDKHHEWLDRDRRQDYPENSSNEERIEIDMTNGRADLRGKNLRGADFTKFDGEVDFSRALMDSATDFTGANLSNVKLHANEVRQAGVNLAVIDRKNLPLNLLAIQNDSPQKLSKRVGHGTKHAETVRVRQARSNSGIVIGKE